MCLLTTVGEELYLTLVLSDDNPLVYPQARVYGENGSSTPVATIDLDYVADGYYRASTAFVVSTAEKFVVVYVVYSDMARTIESTLYTRSEETIISDAAPLVGSSF